MNNEDDDVGASIQEAVVASLTRLGALIAEANATTRELIAARDAAAAKLNAGADRAQILEEIAASIDAREPRFAKVVSWIEAEGSTLDAATTRLLDRAEQSRDDPGVRVLLEGLAEMGVVATTLEETQRGSVNAWDSLTDHPALRRPAGRHAGNLERLATAGGSIRSIGERAQRILDA